MQPVANETRFAETPPENYQRFFVPAIGGPIAEDLIAAAHLQRGEHVLDIACGTGVVTRLAADHVGASGSVAGLDPNPGMLSVARASTPEDQKIKWYEASAEAIPLADASFDVVLCQMGLQFFADKPAALREMHRILKPGGRIYINVPGPKPPLFAIMTEALGKHISPQAAAFGDTVFSLHNGADLTQWLNNAGFSDVKIQARPKTLELPAPAEFLWEYLYSTPLAEAISKAGEKNRRALERDVCASWKSFTDNNAMTIQVGMTTVSAVH